MKIFKRIVILFWLAIPGDILLTAIPWFRHHGAPEALSLIALFALLLTAAYKIGRVYRVGMSR